METFSALLALCAGNSPVPVNSPHKGQWRGALMFSLICAWINGWVNNREAGDFRRHRGHYDVNVMSLEYSVYISNRSPTMYLSQTPQCTIQNRNVYISVLNGAFWAMEQVQCGICEFGLAHEGTLCVAFVSSASGICSTSTIAAL